MTYMISSLSYCATKREQSKRRKFYGAIISTLITLCYPFVKNDCVLYALKCCVWVLLSVVLYLKKQKVGISALTLLAITFCVAGGIAFLDSIIKIEGVYSIQKITVIGFIISSLLRLLLVRVAHFGTYSQYRSDITLQIQGIKRTIKAYTDTGNLIVDEKSGLSVVILTVKALSPYLKADTVKLFNSGRYLFYSSVDGIKKKLFIIDGCKVFANGKDCDVVVGVTRSKLIDDVDAIIGPKICE